MTKLTDLQLALLSTAAQRSDGGLLPPAASITTQVARIRRSIATLVRRGLAADVEVTDRALSYRADGDTLFGGAITDAGRSVVGTEPPAAASAPPPTDAAAHQVADADGRNEVGNDAAGSLPGAPRTGSKSALVVGLLSREHGATIDELTAATGWLPHTTRAALTGLRKKGHAIARISRDGKACYNVAVAV